MFKYSGACNFYYRGKRCVPMGDSTWSSIARFGSRRWFCTLELATSTIKAKFVFLCGPRRGLTWSSIVRFCGGRCSSTLEPATSTIGAEGVFLCADTTRERSHLELYKQIWR